MNKFAKKFRNVGIVLKALGPIKLRVGNFVIGNDIKRIGRVPIKLHSKYTPESSLLILCQPRENEISVYAFVNKLALHQGFKPLSDPLTTFPGGGVRVARFWPKFGLKGEGRIASFRARSARKWRRRRGFRKF